MAFSITTDALDVSAWHTQVLGAAGLLVRDMRLWAALAYLAVWAIAIGALGWLVWHVVGPWVRGKPTHTGDRPAPAGRGVRVAGAVLLVLLPAVWAGMLARSATYDEARYRFDPAQYATRAPVAAQASQPVSLRAHATRAADPIDRLRRQLPGTVGIGTWRRDGRVETFPAPRLSEKIDGQAEAYLAFDAQALVCEGWRRPGDTYPPLDIYIYDMRRPLNAFGKYAEDRPPGATRVDIGRDAYTAGGSVFFWKGRFYTRIELSVEDAQARRVALALARQIANHQPDEQVDLDVFRLFPEGGRVPGSERYIRRAGFGHAPLRHVFAQAYQRGRHRATVFVMNAGQVAPARQVMTRLSDLLARDGKRLTADAPPKTDQYVKATSFGKVHVVFRRANLVAGVMRATDQAWADELAARWAHRLADAPPDAVPGPQD